MKMSKKSSREEQEKLAREVLESTNHLEILGPIKNLKSLKNPIEKVENYQLLVRASAFWASRQTYLEMVQSFLSKKIDGDTLTSKFYRLRGKDMRSGEQLERIIEDRILPIPDLYYTFKAEEFSLAINELFMEIDRYDPNIINDSDINDPDWCNLVYSENQLRLVIQKEFVPRFEQSCGLNDSFFRP